MAFSSLLRYTLFLLLFIHFAAQAQANNAVVNLHLARPSIVESPTNQYIHALLTQSFAKVGKDVNFIYSLKPMNKKRITGELYKPGGINLAWLSIEPSAHNDLLHTSSPLYKGIHGKRLLMINKNQQAIFKRISSLNQLKPLVGLQKQSWSDYKVLKRSGLTVNGELSYKSMIKALDTNLGDYFPRSVSAIEAELAKQKHVDLMIEPTIMLQYPSHYYFYTHNRNKDLLILLESGLTQLQQSGEFELLYQRFFGEKEKRLNLSSRKVFNLE